MIPVCDKVDGTSHKGTAFVETFVEEFVIIKEVTLRPYGGSLGTTLPKAMTDWLTLSAGDKARAAETDHSVLLAVCEPGVAQGIEAEARMGGSNRYALQELAR